LLFAYIYNPGHWWHIPATEEIISITSSLSRVYVAVPDGILTFDRHRLCFINSFTPLDGIPERIKLCAYDQFSGSLLILADNRLTFFSPKTRAFTTFTLSFNPHSLGIGERNICFLTDKEKYVWERKKFRFKKIKTFPDTAILWYGRLSPNRPENYPYLAPYYIMDADLGIYPIKIAFEEGKRLWLGVKNYGIIIYDLHTRHQIKEFRFGKGVREIKGILKRSDGLWLISHNLFTRIGGNFEDWDYFLIKPAKFFTEKNPLLSFKFLDLTSEGITALSEDDHFLSFSTPDKFYLYDKKTERVITELNLPNIHRLFHHKGIIFILTPTGVFLYSISNNELTDLIDPKGDLRFGAYDISLNNFGVVFAIRGGFLQLRSGTPGGEMAANQWQKFLIPGMNLSCPVNNIAGFGDYLFLGTEKEGLIAFNQKKDRYITLKEKEGLLSLNIRALYADSSYLWIATDKGLSRCSYRELF